MCEDSSAGLGSLTTAIKGGDEAALKLERP